MKHASLLALAASILSGPTALWADPADTVETVMQADRNFAAMARSDGLAEAFRHYASGDARLLAANSDDIVGPSAIFESRQGADGAILAWGPRGGYAGEAGDFAVTYGSWGYYPDGDESVPPAATGDYITVWRLEDGVWRYVLDGGNADRPQPPADTPE